MKSPWSIPAGLPKSMSRVLAAAPGADEASESTDDGTNPAAVLIAAAGQLCSPASPNRRAASIVEGAATRIHPHRRPEEGESASWAPWRGTWPGFPFVLYSRNDRRGTRVVGPPARPMTRIHPHRRHEEGESASWPPGETHDPDSPALPTRIGRRTPPRYSFSTTQSACHATSARTSPSATVKRAERPAGVVTVTPAPSAAPG